MDASAIPTIDTPRLRLRAHRPGDFERSFAMWRDPNVVRHIGAPSSGQQAWMRLLTYAGHWAFMDYGYWAIEERESGAFVGDVGFADFHRDVAASMKGVPEMGWVIAPAVAGRGYASEATSAALAWADDKRSWPRSVCMIHPENAASLRVAEKCGFREFDRADVNAQPTIFFERMRNGGAQ